MNDNNTQFLLLYYYIYRRNTSVPLFEYKFVIIYKAGTLYNEENECLLITTDKAV